MDLFLLKGDKFIVLDTTDIMIYNTTIQIK